jgi:phosphate:Na+ symporter
MTKIIALLVAGLGLFFIGMHLVSIHLKQASSRRFRSLIARFTDRVWRGSLLGLFAGVFMQSTSAISVILASMSASGLITVQQALPIVTWANVGTTLIVFLGVFDVQILVMYCLGLSAITFVFSGEARWKPLCGVVLGISFLFFGIQQMKTSAAGLQSFEWFEAVMAQAQGSYVLAFIAGVLLSFLTQSTTAVALLAVTLAHAGLLQLGELMMVVYGGNVGSTFARMLLSTGLKGSSRQIGRFQDLFKIGGSLLFVGLFYLEWYGRVPLVGALCRILSNRLDSQTAFINLFCNLAPALLFTPLLGPTQRVLDRFWPATAAEDFAKLKYLHPQALSDPETAIDLIEKEQMRLLTRLPDYFQALRSGDPRTSRIENRAIHQAFGTLFKEVQSYVANLLQVPLAHGTSERLTNVHDRHAVIGYLEETVHQIVSSVEETPPSAQLAPLVQNMTEALDFLLRTAGEAVTTLEADEADMMANLCGDRGNLLARIRNLYLSSEQGLLPQDKMLLLGLTTHFDRIVWLVRRLAELLQQNRQFRP